MALATVLKLQPGLTPKRLILKLSFALVGKKQRGEEPSLNWFLAPHFLDQKHLKQPITGCFSLRAPTVSIE